jgi:UDP-glucose 6-dehydrogenase
MARNLAQRLDRLERLAAELLNTNQGPIYLREGQAIPDGIAPERVVTIKRVFLDPPEHAAEELPATIESSPAIERPSPSFTRPLATPPLGIV